MSNAPKDNMLSRHVYEATLSNFHQVAGNYLEIGVFNGLGTGQVARQFPNKVIYAIDPFIEDGHTGTGERGAPLKNQREAFGEHTAGLENVVLFDTTSDEFAKLLTDEMIADMNVEWVIVDGSHHYEDVSIDGKLAMRLFGDRGGVILFDDLGHTGVRQAVDEFLIERKDRIAAHSEFAGGAAAIVQIAPVLVTQE
jgi:hypothetical protein